MSHGTLLDLSRWHWALTAAFHITFPAVTVGTSLFLMVCYAMYIRTATAVCLHGRQVPQLPSIPSARIALDVPEEAA